MVIKHKCHPWVKTAIHNGGGGGYYNDDVPKGCLCTRICPSMITDKLYSIESFTFDWF